MKRIVSSFSLTLIFLIGSLFFGTSLRAQNYSLAFYEGTFNFKADSSIQIPAGQEASDSSVRNFYIKINAGNYQPLIESLVAYKKKHDLNDWLYYQLIRKTAEQLSPKKDNYYRYTLYKWFLMVKSGYDAKVAVGNNQIIFYVRNEEDIAHIPFFEIGNQKYMCLNYHDYGKLFQKENTYKPVKIKIDEANQAFSYKVTKMPDFKQEDYFEKQLSFNYKHKAYHFNIKVTNEVSNIFNNYPIVNFESYFNIPLSKQTYESLIPVLKQNTRKLSVKNGVDYLMRFTRYAFLYEDDENLLGKEKRFSPEQTLLVGQSDCDDRAALFFYLVKELYNLPMIAILYPSHLTMAVQFEKPIGEAILYEGKAYTICEPTPQKKNLKIGEVSSNLKASKYEIVYAYVPPPLK